MNTSISQTALRSGLSVYLIIVALLFTKAASFILLTICVAPGLVYGLALISSARNPVTGFRRLFFVLLSMTINFACVYFVSRDFLDVDYNPNEALNSVACSTIAAVLLTMCYGFLILRRFSVFRTVVMPSVLGIASSLHSAFCMYLLGSDRYNDFVSYMLWVGMLSIFPLWQYLIGLNMEYHSRAA